VSESDKPFQLGAVRPLPDVHVAQLLLLEVPHLRALLPDADAALANTRHEGNECASDGSTSRQCGYFNLVDDSSVIVGDIVRTSKQKNVSRAFVRAGPRATTFFEPQQVRAAIVTCGGLCPGLNNVIRELVDCLHFSYGCNTVYGVRHGYWGFHTQGEQRRRFGDLESGSMVRVCFCCLHTT
jgi:6-phosphofructokinase 1